MHHASRIKRPAAAGEFSVCFSFQFLNASVGATASSPPLILFFHLLLFPILTVSLWTEEMSLEISGRWKEEDCEKRNALLTTSDPFVPFAFSVHMFRQRKLVVTWTLSLVAPSFLLLCGAQRLS